MGGTMRNRLGRGWFTASARAPVRAADFIHADEQGEGSKRNCRDEPQHSFSIAVAGELKAAAIGSAWCRAEKTKRSREYQSAR